MPDDFDSMLRDAEIPEAACTVFREQFESSKDKLADSLEISGPFEVMKCVNFFISNDNDHIKFWQPAQLAKRLKESSSSPSSPS